MQSIRSKFLIAAGLAAFMGGMALPAHAQQTEIVLWDIQQPGDGSPRGEAFKKNLEAFEAQNPDIKVRVDDEEAGEHLTAATLAAADTVHKELQNSDSRWTKDRLGFNVEIHADAGWTPQPNKSYLIKVQFNWTDAAPSYKFYRVRTASSAFSTPV